MVLHKKLKMNLEVKIFIIFLLTILLQGTSSSRTIGVCDEDCSFSSITEGINSANPGDTIEVQSGIYSENVNVSKTIALIGLDTGLGKPVIDAHGNGSALAIFADGVTIEGFNLTNALGSGVEILAGIEVNSNKNVLRNNLLFNNENGILINGHNNIVLDNNASNDIYGIRAKSSDNNTMSDNTLMNSNYGLFLLDSNNNIINRNQAMNNGFGIMINESFGNNLTQNKMIGNSYSFSCQGKNRIDTTNLVDGKPIYYLVGSFHQLINKTSGAAMVSCINCKDITIIDLDLRNNFYGIYLENTSHAVLEGNSLRGNRIGVALTNSYYNHLSSNNASGNTVGFKLEASRYNALQENDAIDNQVGLYLASSDYNRIIGDRFSENERGLLIRQSYQNLVSKNSLLNNSLGAELDHSLLSELYNNNISDNDQGILLKQSANNNLLGNRLFNNSEAILYDPLDNNTLGANNLYRNNTANLTVVRYQTTEGVIPPGKSVVIVCNPKDAVIINGEETRIGTGPVHFTDPGEYRVLVKKPGYKDGTVTIEIPFPESEVEKSIDLIPEENA